ncbi:methylated-DNA--[protein]-cysteine S-methyltransferase [Tahibacter sp. P2K]|uniref:Methylated-DNA--protein-cysteine methyltransferase n=1 Tax=Tahibacter harae TaxID=2963937 RepID=A0ABT1QKY5_9GAMM|nr:methylated-DNA--[protein]-cysteine S-methyltransferase [Tahibacter harae]
MSSPLGKLQLVASERGLAAVLWPQEDGSRVRLGPFLPDRGSAVLAETERQLDSYFKGTLRRFSLPLDFHGTPFQQRVWQALLGIPWGETRSYGQLARELGCPAASRAVGAANGRNPISIIAPCHRVLGADGKLTGFAGGLAAKQYLLRMERGETPEAIAAA